MFKLMTDTSANLEPNVISAYDIGVIPFNYYLNGDERTCMDIAAFDGKAYYDAIRSGAKASTSQVPPQRYIEYMEPVLKQGLDILFIGHKRIIFLCRDRCQRTQGAISRKKDNNRGYSQCIPWRRSFCYTRGRNDARGRGYRPDSERNIIRAGKDVPGIHSG